MEVKINVEDLRELLSAQTMKDYYYEKLQDIAVAFQANQHDKIKVILDSLLMGGGK